VSDSARGAFAREGAAWLVHGLMYGFGYIPSSHRPRRAKDIRTLVFIHGLGANRSSFYPLQAYLRLMGFRRQYSFNYDARDSIEEMGRELKARLSRNVRGGRIDIIGHSLGGVIAREYVQRQGGARRVDNVITIASPHQGTHASVYVPTRLIRQLQPGSPAMQRLAASPVPDNVRFTSLAAGHDLMVLPASSALLPFGESHMYEDMGHLEIMLSPRIFARVHQSLEAANS
jgi:triacylglycerol lipase